MFDQLDLSPMVVVLLLLYGLLLAVCLVVWTALDMSGRSKPAAAEPAGKKRERAGKSRGEPQAAQAQAARPQPSQAQTAQATQEPGRKSTAAGSGELRRAADSESVVSYSVRQRVTAPGPGTTPRKQEAAPVSDRQVAPDVRARQEPRVESGRPEVPRATEAPVIRPPEPQAAPKDGQDFKVGRSSRLPRSGGGTVTPRADEPGASQAAADRATSLKRGKSEDAFERFLRSSSNDNDDY